MALLLSSRTASESLAPPRGYSPSAAISTSRPATPRAAEGPEQTIYNYLQTSEQPVTDRDQHPKTSSPGRSRHAHPQPPRGRPPGLRAELSRQDPPSSRRPVAWRARAPGRDQPNHPPPGGGREPAIEFVGQPFDRRPPRVLNRRPSECAGAASAPVGGRIEAALRIAQNRLDQTAHSATSHPSRDSTS